jgi:hypothetical protein
MPRIRIEWIPVQLFALGLLGFDHLQLVYQPDDVLARSRQDDWFVMEGVREVGMGPSSASRARTGAPPSRSQISRRAKIS